MQQSHFIVNSLRFWLSYGNPLEILYNRKFNPKGDVRVVDRASKTEVRCKVASYAMFGEVWHDHDYDIPRVPIRSGDVVVDIGGNQGFYSTYAASQGAKVLVFEPVPSLFKTLESNVAKNGLSSRVTASCCGVSDRKGQIEMILTDQLGGGMNTIVGQFAAQNQIEVSQKIQVELTTFEDILADNHVDRVRICKLDCEGAEYMILKAMTAETAAKVDAFVIEYHWAGYDIPELIRHILSWGTHQVAYAEDKYCERMILRAIRTDLLSNDEDLSKLSTAPPKQTAAASA
jgi:FkbM family methyltransferase